MASQDLVEIKLDRPYRTNDKVYGYQDETRDGKRVKVFTGIAKVTPEEAEDLERRQAEYRAYEAGLHGDKGKNSPVFM